MDLRARLEGSLRYRLLELSRRVHALTARSDFDARRICYGNSGQRADEFTAHCFGIAGAARRFAQAPEQRAPARSVFDFRAKNWGLAIAPSAAHQELGRARRTFAAHENVSGGNASRCNAGTQPAESLSAATLSPTDAAGNVLRDANRFNRRFRHPSLRRGRLISEVKKRIETEVYSSSRVDF